MDYVKNANLKFTQDDFKPTQEDYENCKSWADAGCKILYVSNDEIQEELSGGFEDFVEFLKFDDGSWNEDLVHYILRMRLSKRLNRQSN